MQEGTTIVSSQLGNADLMAYGKDQVWLYFREKCHGFYVWR
jgi:hypothetical protein